MVRWDMAAQPRHVFHRIGMISIYRGQQHKRFCWFFQGSLSVPFQRPNKVMLFGCENRCCVYPMTLQECKGQSTLQRHLRQELICGEFQSPPPSSDVTNFFLCSEQPRNFTLKFGGSSCVCYGCEMSRGGPLCPCPICHPFPSLSALHLYQNLRVS